VSLRNTDASLSDLALRGYTGVISHGYNTGLARAIWVKNTAYSLDDVRTPTTVTGYQYRCSVAGTSHATTEPTWPTGLGAVVTDGTVTWEMDGLTGSEYARTPPLRVKIPDFFSSHGQTAFSLNLIGIPDQLALDGASADYNHHASSTKTVKDLFTEIADGQPVSEVLVEEQTTVDSGLSLVAGGYTAAGQKLLILNRTVSKVSFKLKKFGNPSGAITYYIRSTGDLSVYAYKVALADADSLTTSYVWHEITLTTPVLINDEVYLECEYTGGDGSNYVMVNYQDSDVKADEFLFALGTQWEEYSAKDCAYTYTYASPGIGVFDECESFTVVYDSEDSLIDTFMPADAFKIRVGDSRWSILDWLLANTKCVMKIGVDGKIHVLSPNVAGTGVSPTSATDTGSGWTNEANAYDGDTATYASSSSIGAGVWTQYLELNIAAMSCGSIRFYAWNAAGWNLLIDLDVYYGGAWHDVYSGTFTDRAWVTKSIGSTQSVTACRIRIYNPGSGGSGAMTLYEVAFGPSDYTFDDDYTDADAHTFFNKSYRNALVLPNRVVVQNLAGTDISEYTSAASYALLPKTRYEKRKLASTAQATSIATAMIQKLEQDAERSTGVAPMNVGQELYDYVNIIDSVQDDERAGNVGFIRFDVARGKFDQAFGFGKMALGGLIGTSGIGGGAGGTSGGTGGVFTYDQVVSLINDVYDDLNLMADTVKAISDRDNIDDISSTADITKLILDTVNPLLTKVVSVDLTGVRLIDTIYRNTSGKIRTVIVTVTLAGSEEVNILVEDATPPTVIIAQLDNFSVGSNPIFIPVTFKVPPSWYYKVVTISGTPGILNFYEQDEH